MKLISKEAIKRINVRDIARGLATVIPLGLGCLLVWSSLPKIRFPYEFLSSVYEYELLGPKLGMLTAMILPWVELLLGLCLIAGVFVSGAMLTCAGIMTMFVYVVASALNRGLTITCGCFGAYSKEFITYWTLTRTLLLLALSIVGYILLLFFSSTTKDRLSDSRVA